MRAHISNAAYGVLDYAAYPVGMLLVAPIVLHHLGLAEYGMWTVATATVSTGGIIAAGFGDANIQHVAAVRSSGGKVAVESAVRCMIGINLTLGAMLALAGWLIAPYASRHIVAPGTPQQATCLIAMRIASVLMLIRALESVSISTLRAFERYGAAVRISIGVRVLTLVAAALLAFQGFGTASIMEATAVMLVLSTYVQFVRLREFLGNISLSPTFDQETTRALFGFGVFSWLQAVAGVVFGQLDRLLVGVALGASAVASYALCVQLAQPLFGLTAAALHFLFPYLSGRVQSLSNTDLKRTLGRASALNFVAIAVGMTLLLLFGEPVLRTWAGESVARSSVAIFPLIVIGSAMLGLGVTGTYALLAFGHARTLAWVNIGGGIAMLTMMGLLLPRSGLHGLAVARLFYGCSGLLTYLPLIRILGERTDAASNLLESRKALPS